MGIQKVLTGTQLGIWSKNFRELGFNIVKKLGNQQVHALAQEANGTKIIDKKGNFIFDLSNKLVNEIVNYCNYVAEGINKLSPLKKPKFISIGQSPAIIAETLQTKGIDTAICPISNLRNYDKKQLKQIAQSPAFDKYLKYLSINFGLDLHHIDKNKKYFFCDFTSSGKGLENFELLLQYKGLKTENMEFKSLQNLAKLGNQGRETPFMTGFIERYIKNCLLKDYCSPIFKLDAQNLSDTPNCLPKNPFFNRLKMMLWDRQINGNLWTNP